MKAGGCILIAAIAIALLAVMPLLAIWSLNTLFGLSIAFTLKNWFAALILSMIVGGAKASAKSN